MKTHATIQIFELPLTHHDMLHKLKNQGAHLLGDLKTVEGRT